MPSLKAATSRRVVSVLLPKIGEVGLEVKGRRDGGSSNLHRSFFFSLSYVWGIGRQKGCLKCVLLFDALSSGGGGLVGGLTEVELRLRVVRFRQVESGPLSVWAVTVGCDSRLWTVDLA